VSIHADKDEQDPPLAERCCDAKGHPAGGKENMNTINRHARKATLAITLSGVLLVCAPLCLAANTQNPQETAAAVKAKLHGSEFKNVQVNVDKDGIATLTGTVPVFEDKVDADHKTHGVKGVAAVRNDIQVGGPNLTDSEIEKKLGPELAYNRVGYGNVFDAILLHVQNGVVTLSGHAHSYPDRDAAVGLAATTPGVKEVIDDIQVDPASAMDWQTRMAVAKAIYDDPALQRYALNPVRPIRISVQNGHVELYGTVAREQDKQIAYMRAQQVPGVFSVKDYLQVEGQPSNQKK
jgi:hyperosmotically inducible protein